MVVGEETKLIRVGDDIKLVRLPEPSTRGINPPMAEVVVSKLWRETNG
jgi:hypothetical protein